MFRGCFEKLINLGFFYFFCMKSGGQGSLEYLLILAAVLAIAVVAVVVANSMMSPAETSASVEDDKYEASVSGVELQEYDDPLDMGSAEAAVETRPERLVYSSGSGKIVFKPFDKWEKCDDATSQFYFGDSGDSDYMEDREAFEDMLEDKQDIEDYEFLFSTSGGSDAFLVEWDESCELEWQRDEDGNKVECCIYAPACEDGINYCSGSRYHCRGSGSPPGYCVHDPGDACGKEVYFIDYENAYAQYKSSSCPE